MQGGVIVKEFCMCVDGWWVWVALAKELLDLDSIIILHCLRKLFIRLILLVPEATPNAIFHFLLFDFFLLFV